MAVEYKHVGAGRVPGPIYFRQTSYIQERRQIVADLNYPGNLSEQAVSQPDNDQFIAESAGRRAASDLFVDRCRYLAWTPDDEIGVREDGQREFAQCPGCTGIFFIPAWASVPYFFLREHREKFHSMRM